MDYAATGVSVTVTDASTGRIVATVAAALNATQQPFGPDWGARPCPKAVCPPYDMDSFTPWSTPIPSWKAFLPPMPAGGNFTITAACSGCAGTPAPLILNDVTFGDVWYCSGQASDGRCAGTRSAARISLPARVPSCTVQHVAARPEHVLPQLLRWQHLRGQPLQHPSHGGRLGLDPLRDVATTVRQRAEAFEPLDDDCRRSP